ncbi:tyrosine-type recombinase/integrase family protein [Nonomuraea sp. K274]|uniref:Tyrosine-type recombinase/integrase family protein n=1 Tax=Nonomuraea cypriaca TaxID=1187855 RepID=A0A931F0H6_9ACTN|nr:site-specific integrase [Nonomuraea cypriaca]MBF8186368.1 tyrosine-type recombinase/integrase family protein [Nonomuraea cypriaca]
MPFTEERNGRWRVRWRLPAGNYASATYDEYGAPFPDEESARAYGLNMEADIRRGIYKDPRAEQLTFREYAEDWYRNLDLERSTTQSYRRMLRGHIMAAFGHLALVNITPDIVNRWERSVVAAGYAISTARTARAVLSSVLDDARRAGRIASNPAEKPRGKGRKADRRIEVFEQAAKVWPSPFEAILIGERIALLSGRERDFVMVLLAAWTGLRWSELLALTPSSLDERGRLKVHWKLYEDDGRWYWGRPKDGSMRIIDLPEWLWEMVRAIRPRRCGCPKDAAAPFCQGREVLFLGERTHHRRSAFSRLYLRPAAEGVYPTKGNAPVLADAATSWPGEPLASWPAAVPGVAYEPPLLRRIARQTPGQVNARSQRAELVAYAIEQGADEQLVARMSREALMDAYLRPRADGLVSWLPILPDLTMHGLRHAHQTWMDDGAIKTALKVERMGHTDYTISARYGHVTDTMRGELLDLLTALRDEALRRRWELSPRSSVRVLDDALAGIGSPVVAPLFSQNSPKTQRARLTG